MKRFVIILVSALPLGACSLTTVCSISLDEGSANAPPLPIAAAPAAEPICQTITDEDGKPARMCQQGDFVEIAPLFDT